MFRKRIELDSASDSRTILGRLRDQCTAAGLSALETDKVIAEVSGPLAALIKNGQAVTSVNGRFCASRQIVTESAVVSLDARFGVPPGLFRRIAKAIARRGC